MSRHDSRPTDDAAHVSGEAARPVEGLDGLTRRRFIGVSGAALAGITLGACSGPAPSPPAGQQPAGAPQSAAASTAFRGGGSLTLIVQAHFVPAFDRWIDQWAQAWGEKNKVEVQVDHLLPALLPEKIAAEVAAEAGHDILQTSRGVTHVYAEQLIDVSDLAKGLGEQHGGWIPAAEQIAVIDGAWRAIPEQFPASAVLYRKDLFDEIGMKPDETWESLVQAGSLLKARGYPVGIQISQRSNDALNTWNAVLWSYGAGFVGRDGKTLTINSPETREALRLGIELYNRAMTPEVLSWDDTSNNLFLASGRGSWINNPISALRTIEKENPELASKIYIGRLPAGPQGRFASASAYQLAIAKWSPNQAAAKAFLVDYFASLPEAFKASEGYNHPLLQAFLKKPMPILGEEPKLDVLQDAHEWTRFTGYPGPTTAAAGEVETNWVIPLMVARAVQDGNLDGAIGWAQGRIEAIYAKHR
jgi:multiple sugar transport system substrate-binding protein